jgi:rRNA maturation endonuclease Nob1
MLDPLSISLIIAIVGIGLKTIYDILRNLFPKLKKCSCCGKTFDLEFKEDTCSHCGNKLKKIRTKVKKKD